MSSIKAILFDFDGLLFNSEPVWDKAYYRFLKTKRLTDQLTSETTGMGLRDFIKLWKKHGLRGDTEDLMQDFRKVFYDFFLKEENILMPGAVQLVKGSKKRGLMVVLTTGGHTQEMVKKILKTIGLLEYFDLVISSDDVKNGKPAPDIYLYALGKLNLEASNCLALEDSVNGILAAKAAQVPVYGVNKNYKMRNDLIKAGAKRAFASLFEIDL